MACFVVYWLCFHSNYNPSPPYPTNSLEFLWVLDLIFFHRGKGANSIPLIYFLRHFSRFSRLIGSKSNVVSKGPIVLRENEKNYIRWNKFYQSKIKIPLAIFGSTLHSNCVHRKDVLGRGLHFRKYSLEFQYF